MSAGPSVELTGGGVLVAVSLLVGGLLAYQGYNKATAGLSGMLDTVKGWVTPLTPAEHQANYSQALEEAQESAALNPWVSLWTHNPNNFNPNDLIPAGYTMNQYGDLVKNPDPITSGGGGIFNGNGASGSW